MWFNVDPCDLAFCERSPHRIVTEAVLPLAPARAFELIADGGELGAWLHDFVACRWTSGAPHGAGSTRQVDLRMLGVKELFLAWDPGERLTFTFTASTVPLMRRAVEDLRLLPLGPTRTRLFWTVHYELRPWASPFEGVARAVFGRLFSRSAENLTRYATEHG